MIKPSQPPQGAKGKQHNRPSPVGNAPLLPTAPPPEGEVLAALCLELLMREMFLCGLLCPRLRGKGGAVRHQRGESCRRQHLPAGPVILNEVKNLGASNKCGNRH